MSGTPKKQISIIIYIILLSLFYGNKNTYGDIERKFTKREVTEGRKIFKKICSFCHGTNGEGDLEVGVPRIGCHGVINKSNKFLYETIYSGRTGEHGLDMPTFGKASRTKLEEDLRYALVSSKRFSDKQIDELAAKVGGVSNKKRERIREPDIIKKFGNLSSDEVYSAIAYLRFMETQPVPDECIAAEGPSYKGDVGEGKRIFMDNCRRCHAEDGKGDSFFMHKRVKPRDLTDSIYMNAVTDEYLEDVITKGGLKMGRSGIMAPFHLSEKEITDVITYIRTLSK